MGKFHPVLAITGGIRIGVTAKVPGTRVNEVIGFTANQEEIRIGHCSGTLSVGANVDVTTDSIKSMSRTVFRTARVLMKGEVKMGE